MVCNVDLGTRKLARLGIPIDLMSLVSLRFIHFHNPLFIKLVSPITTPLPVLRFLDQPPTDRVPMNIPQFLHTFSFRPDVEVIPSGLPEMGRIQGGQFS